MGKTNKNDKKFGFRKFIYIGVAAVLVVGLGIGALIFDFGGQLVDDSGFEEARPHLEQQLRMEKEHEVLMQHIDGLREQSDIVKRLEDFDKEDGSTVIAEVNGEEILSQDLIDAEEVQKQQFIMMGLDPESPEADQMIEEIREDILDSLIMNVILLQKVRQEGIMVSSQEIDEQYQMIAEQFGGEEVMEDMLEEEGMTPGDLEDEIEKQISLQTYAEKYLEENLDEEDLEFSEQELRRLFEQQQEMLAQ